MKTMNRLASLAFALVLPLAACGHKAASEPTTPTAGSGAISLKLAEVTVLKGDQEVFKLHADGTTEMAGMKDGQIDWQKGPTWTADGKIKMGEEEKAHLTGTEIVASADKKMAFTIADKKVTTADAAGTPVEFTIDDAGALSITGAKLAEGANGLRLQAASAEDRQTGLVIFTATFLLHASFEPASETSGAVQAEPAPPASK
jgi:hypothetical protein